MPDREIPNPLEYDGAAIRRSLPQTNGIVWVLDLSAWASNGPAILDAYGATNVANLLFSSPSTGTGAAGPAVKFTIPTVANGKVYVGGQSIVTVFGLLPN